MVSPGSSFSPLDQLTMKLYARLAGLEAEWHARSAACTSADSVAAESARCTAEWRGPLTAELDALYAEMSAILPTLGADARTRSMGLYRRLVQPFFLQSPFVRRATDKPLGYPGDYGLVEMIFRGREMAATPLGAVLGSYALGAGPSEAHRGRLPWAHRVMEAHLADRGIARPRVLSFACGPEVVLRKWVAGGRQADIVLADHDPNALAWASQRLLRERGAENTTTVTTVEANAFALVQGARLESVLGTHSGFDVVLVLGLLDYLDDDQVVAFLRALAPALRPHGLLLTSNLHVDNPWRALMELTADWTVAHRTVEGFEALVDRTRILGRSRTDLHPSRTNLYNAAQLSMPGL